METFPETTPLLVVVVVVSYDVFFADDPGLGATCSNSSFRAINLSKEFFSLSYIS